jgi:asparagine synthase (glutamine-hydrolysing)
VCGLAGGVFSKSIDIDTRMSAALNSLNHRGPNDQGYDMYRSADSRIALGHTRLSIIDLSDAGHQPMRTKDDRYSIVFNGEIYNYKELKDELKDRGYAFFSDSDTEVLLAAWATWGQGCLQKLTGMFSFAIYDNQLNVLTCVRDPFGIKPLFYARDNKSFIFASEVSPLLMLKSHTPELNLQRAYDYLVYGQYDNAEDTFYSGVYHLLPGYLIEVPVQSPEEHFPVRWWRPRIEEKVDWTFKEAVKQVRAEFLKSVQLNLRSDVPIGAALSGGIDSSAIVCAIRYLESEIPIHTFSYIAKGSDLSEEVWVDKVNTYVGATSHKVVVNTSELIADLDEMILAQGEPFGSTSIYAQYRVFKKAHDAGITVTLDGQGADEMLAGYDGYPGSRLKSLLEVGKVRDFLKFIEGWSAMPGRTRLGALKKLIGECVQGNIYNALRWVNGTGSTPDWINKKPLNEMAIRLTPPRSHISKSASGRALVARLANALTCDGLPALLRHGDRNSMHYSIESRVPFLTTDLVQLLLSMPEKYLVSCSGQTKYVFREAMRGIVPDEVLDRKDKVGFATPEKDLLLSNPALFREWLTPDLGLPFLNQRRMLDRFNSVVQGREEFSPQVWRWVNFCRWYKINEFVTSSD